MWQLCTDETGHTFSSTSRKPLSAASAASAANASGVESEKIKWAWRMPKWAPRDDCARLSRTLAAKMFKRQGRHNSAQRIKLAFKWSRLHESHGCFAQCQSRTHQKRWLINVVSIHIAYEQDRFMRNVMVGVFVFLILLCATWAHWDELSLCGDTMRHWVTWANSQAAFYFALYSANSGTKSLSKSKSLFTHSHIVIKGNADLDSHCCTRSSTSMAIQGMALFIEPLVLNVPFVISS